MRIVRGVALVMLATSAFLFANLAGGGFESAEPNYFNSGGSSATAVLNWDTGQYRTGMHSIAIMKPDADGDAYWMSEDLSRYWAVFSGPDVATYYGAWVKLDGVNIDPMDDTEKIQLIFTFMDDDGTDLLGAPLILDIPQDAATTEWMEIIAPFPLSFPVNVADIFVEFRMGDNATGNAYLDDLFLRPAVEGEWAGDMFNCNLDLPDGWFTWFDSFGAGKAEWSDEMPQSGWQCGAYAHSGDYSLRMDKYVEETELVIISDPVDFINDGSPLIFSAYVKTMLPEGMAEMANADGSYAMGFTVTWHDGTCGADGWGEVGGTDYRFTVAGDSTDWTLYQAVMTPPENATQFSLRTRYWHYFMGTTFWDDITVVKAEAAATELEGGDFESALPNYFMTGGTSPTAETAWSSAEFRTGMHSLLINKPTADGTAYWTSDDLSRYWAVFSGPDVATYYGAWVKLAGVNTMPADDSEKIQISFTFTDDDGVDLLGGPLVLDIPQDAADTDWMEIIAPFPLSFPVNVADIYAEFIMNDNATGMAYLDDYFLRPAVEGEWAGDMFNCNVDLPHGWFTWFDSFGAGKAEWSDEMPQSGWQCSEFSYTGDYSLRMDKYVEETELVVISDPVTFNNTGNPLLISAYVKTDLPEGMADMANADGSYAMGLTLTWHDGTCGADGWGEVGGTDYRFTVAGDETDWTLYQAVMTPPENATQYSLRTRYWHYFTGTTYWDNITVQQTTSDLEFEDYGLPNAGFEGDEPNYFDIESTSPTAELAWCTEQYRTGMHSVAIMKPEADGTAAWISEDLSRYWAVFSGPDVATYYGGWVKLAGVNTMPADDSEKIQLSFTFMDDDGTDLLGAPLVLDVPQDAADTEWMEIIAPFPLSFPVNVADIFVEFTMGENATGNAYLDDLFLRPAVEGEWAGDMFNCNLDLPDGWFTWWDSFGAGKPEWSDAMPQSGFQTHDFAHSGESSLQIEKYVEETEVVVNSDPYTFVNDGTPLAFSAWVKFDLPEGMADMANTDGSYAAGFTVTWHDGTCGADGWGELGGTDYRFTDIPGDQTDWVHFRAVMEPPEGATQYSLRARNWHYFQGTSYWDDFMVEYYEAVMGDINMDDALDILDVVVAVAVILGTQEVDNVAYNNADLNDDGSLDILDVVWMVDIILNGRGEPATTAEIVHADNTVTLSADGMVGAVQITLSHTPDFSLNLTENALVRDYHTSGMTTTLIVVAPEAGTLFTATGEFEITEAVAASSNGYIDVGYGSPLPESFQIGAAYPNPFNPAVNLDFSIPDQGMVNITVYDLMGREITTLMNQNLSTGSYQVTWDAADNVASGVYFIRVLMDNQEVSIQKVMFLK